MKVIEIKQHSLTWSLKDSKNERVKIITTNIEKNETENDARRCCFDIFFYIEILDDDNENSNDSFNLCMNISVVSFSSWKESLAHRSQNPQAEVE